MLAVDQTIDQEGDAKVALGKTATLELTEAQAEILALSRQLGTIALALRSILDSASSTPESDEGDNKHDHSINMVRFELRNRALSARGDLA